MEIGDTVRVRHNSGAWRDIVALVEDVSFERCGIRPNAHESLAWFEPSELELVRSGGPMTTEEAEQLWLEIEIERDSALNAAEAEYERQVNESDWELDKQMRRVTERYEQRLKDAGLVEFAVLKRRDLSWRKV